MDEDDLAARVIALCEAKDFAAAHSLIDADQVNVPVEMRLRLHAAVFLVSGRASRAAEMIDHAVVYSAADDAGALARTAQFMIWSRQPTIAVSCARRALAIDADQWRAHLVLGEVALNRHNLPAATQSARRAVELAPEEAEPHLLLARVLFAQPRSRREARIEAQRAVALDPDNEQARSLAATGGRRWRRWVGLLVTAAAIDAAEQVAHALGPWFWLAVAVIVVVSVGVWMAVAFRRGDRLSTAFGEKRALAHDEFRAAAAVGRFGDLASTILPFAALVTWATPIANVADGAHVGWATAALPAADLLLPLVFGPFLLDWWYGPEASRAIWRASLILRIQTWFSSAVSLAAATLLATSYHSRPIATSLLIGMFAWFAACVGIFFRAGRN